MSSQGWDTTEYRANRLAVIAAATHCALCRRPLTDDPYPLPMSSEADHITPRKVARALGWSWSRVNARENLQAAHRVCNIRRKAGDGKALERPPSPWE